MTPAKFDTSLIAAHMDERVFRVQGAEYPITPPNARGELRFDALVTAWMHGEMTDETYTELVELVNSWMPDAPAALLEELPMIDLRNLGVFACTGVLPKSLLNGVEEGEAPTASESSSGPSAASPATSEG